MKKIWIFCAIGSVALLIILALIVFHKKDNNILEDEQNRFKAVHSQHYDQLDQLILLLDSIGGEYSITVVNGEAAFENNQGAKETISNDRLMFESIAKCSAELFGDDISIRKRIEQGEPIIVIEKRIDVSESYFKHSWISVSLWYCDDQSSPTIQKQIKMHGDTMIWLDQHFAMITVGLV